MEAIQKSLTNKIYDALNNEVTAMTIDRLAVAVGVSEMRVQTCVREMMTKKMIQLAPTKGYCVRGMSDRTLSAADGKKRATELIEKRTNLEMDLIDLDKKRSHIKYELRKLKNSDIHEMTGVSPRIIQQMSAGIRE